MRISDWSSDVCSSDLHDLVRDEPLIPPVARLLERPRPYPAGIDDRLHGGGRRRAAALPAAHAAVAVGKAEQCRDRARQHFLNEGRHLDAAHVIYSREHRQRHDRVELRLRRARDVAAIGVEARLEHLAQPRLAEHLPRLAAGHQQRRRSEEHTSELQSLMRISYAVFCLKKKKNKYNKQSATTTE